MKKIIFPFSLLAILSLMNTPPLEPMQYIPSLDLCSLTGYTLIDCSQMKPIYDFPKSLETEIELRNGMIFAILEPPPTMGTSREVYVFAMRVDNTDDIFYKLLIEGKGPKLARRIR